MRFILLAISLFIVSNTYAAIDNESYIYSDNSNESRLAKEKLRIAQNNLAETQLELFKTSRDTAYRGYDKDEVVYRVGDVSRQDIGVKIGMNQYQVLNKSYWGKPEYVNTAFDGHDKLELWTYKRYTSSSTSDGLLFFINGKLTNKVLFARNQ